MTLVETRCSPCFINNLFSYLELHNENAKLAEIEAIGFDFLRWVPMWHVKQSIMLQLARAYNVESNTLRVDVGDIRVTAKLIGNVFGIPSKGDPIPELQKKNASHLALKRQFQKKTITQLRDFVFGCPMETKLADYLPMAPPSNFGCLKPQKISLAVSDIEVVARCNKKIPNREPQNMRFFTFRA
ncbi:uncharacterized protein DS421_11g320500 [Arachis hypogaea]|nr:uncharacterized protein DS421_11g320500 [Arachis hypogaea]